MSKPATAHFHPGWREESGKKSELDSPHRGTADRGTIDKGKLDAEETSPPSVEQTAFMALELERTDLIQGIRTALLAGASPEMIAERMKNNHAKPALVQLSLLAARYIRSRLTRG